MNTTAFRAALVLFAFILLIGLAFYLHREEPELKKSEIVKILNSGLVIIGLMYSILTYESNQVKIRHDIRISKCSTTYKAMGEWYASPMTDYIKICKEFECKDEYQLLVTDIEKFMILFEENVSLEYRKSLVCILNYFEIIATAINEDLMDEMFMKKYFRRIFFHFYESYFLFIEQRRKIQNEPEIWKEFTSLALKWKYS